jgi:hypothetical protein
MAIFGTFYHKLGNVWPQEYIADNGEVFYLRRRAGEQLVFIAANILYSAEGEKNNAVIEYPAVAQMDADCNEHCTIERAGRLLRLNAKECRLGSCELEWHERRKIIDNIKG